MLVSEWSWAVHISELCECKNTTSLQRCVVFGTACCLSFGAFPSIWFISLSVCAVLDEYDQPSVLILAHRVIIQCFCLFEFTLKKLYNSSECQSHIYKQNGAYKQDDHVSHRVVPYMDFIISVMAVGGRSFCAYFWTGTSFEMSQKIFSFFHYLESC